MREPKYPIIEVFGPTIQGEGPHAGRVCCFVRTGGCDYRCGWCDTPYAVDPAQVRANSEKLTGAQVVERLPPDAHTVVLSGGNPALLTTGNLAEAIVSTGRVIHVETQGTVWRRWLTLAELLVVSPKPPSSGMAEQAERDAPAFIRKWRLARTQRSSCPALALKFVVADVADLKWALKLRDVIDRDHELPLYLSALTPPACSLDVLAASYRNLCDLVLASRVAIDHSPVVLPQLHVVAWGHARAV